MSEQLELLFMPERATWPSQMSEPWRKKCHNGVAYTAEFPQLWIIYEVFWIPHTSPFLVWISWCFGWVIYVYLWCFVMFMYVCATICYYTLCSFTFSFSAFWYLFCFASYFLVWKFHYSLLIYLNFSCFYLSFDTKYNISTVNTCYNNKW